jgi:hypothetical protein
LTLFVETALIRPYSLVLDDAFAAITIGNGLVVVGFADWLAPNNLCNHCCACFYIVLNYCVTL